MAIDIVDLPIENGDFPYLCKRLPEGNGTSTIMGILCNGIIIYNGNID